jgi:hypothetical protein
VKRSTILALALVGVAVAAIFYLASRQRVADAAAAAADDGPVEGERPSTGAVVGAVGGAASTTIGTLIDALG